MTRLLFWRWRWSVPCRRSYNRHARLIKLQRTSNLFEAQVFCPYLLGGLPISVFLLVPIVLQGYKLGLASQAVIEILEG